MIGKVYFKDGRVEEVISCHTDYCGYMVRREFQTRTSRYLVEIWQNWRFEESWSVVYRYFSKTIEWLIDNSIEKVEFFDEPKGETPNEHD